MQEAAPVPGSVARVSQVSKPGRKRVGPGDTEFLRAISDVRLSPDGQRVVFVLSEFIPGQARRRKRIWFVKTTGDAEPEPLIRDALEDSCPRWSPNGRYLAFVSRIEEQGARSKPQLYIQPAEGGEAKRLCMLPNGVSDLEWSPDSSRIAFLSPEGEETGLEPRVTMSERAKRLWAVYVGRDIPEPITAPDLSVWEFSWSPDGRQFALFYSTEIETTAWYRGQLGVVSARGGMVQQLGQLDRQASSLAWSPDGKRLAYVSGQWSDPCRGGGDLYEIAIESGEARNLTPGATCSPCWCQWFPDGKRLLYAAWSGLTQQIGVLDAASGSLKLLADDFVMDRSWPTLAPTPDMRAIATTYNNHKQPPDVYFCELAEPGTPLNWRRLTQMNPIPEQTWELAASERIRYESVDGWQIDALYTPPLKLPSSGLPPLIVNVHGGPSWAYVDDLADSWTQMLASAGYAQLRPNIRGSWGRGVAFADAVVGDMGGQDFQDVLRGVDELIARGLVDGERVGIVGWSYGGFMVAWAVTQTTRFKAAVMGAGICDFHSFHAQSNIPDWDLRFLGASMFESSELYRKQSAITYAERVETPTLIVHGESDTCVPVNQAYAFYRALRERQVPVELAVYPREDHGFAEREHIQDMDERVLRWLDRYV